MIGRRASRTACDAERRTIVEILAAGRGSELARDLPGTGSKTGACGVPGRWASRTAYEAERRTIVEILAAGRGSELARDLPGTGSKTGACGGPGR
ncbi:hypothetical protein [Pseudomonas sp. ICMP 10191]|uniref:hypothetical protein n=1 Tax=Pseudomonas sp. ICMP 10191 TaxID=1198294 RepID=UPI000A685944|nr:hypothetical protein [Pseudomonas sp. ICMP 10191]